MRRREFITLFGGAAAWPVAARAQGGRPRRIGVLTAYAQGDAEAQSWHGALRNRLEQLGWSDGGNLRIDYRWAAGNLEQLDIFAKELVELQPDLIFAVTTPSVAALLRRTRVIPIVFVVVSDPIGSGFVASLARPGGNVTGFTNIQESMAGKLLELLKEAVAKTTRATFLFNPDTAPYATYYVGPFQAAARSLEVEPVVAPVHDAAEIERAIVSLASAPGGGLIVMPDTSMAVHRDLIISLAERHRVPAVYPFAYYATSGGLMAYGNDRIDQFRQAAGYVDRILRGERPADLPVQAPAKFELIVNLRTAKALGLTIPESFLLRADQVIE